MHSGSSSLLDHDYTELYSIHACMCLQTYPSRVESNDGTAIVGTSHIRYIQVEVTIMKTAREEILNVSTCVQEA